MTQRFVIFLIVIALQASVWGMQINGGKTVWDGVYSETQAQRGQILFDATCRRCKGNIMDPMVDSPLKGVYFMDRWREDTLDTFFTFVKTNMPPPRVRATNPGLSDNGYAEVLAFILKVNAFPAGTEELSAETVRSIRMVGPDGPKPLPNGALVQLVGCLTRAEDNVWRLERASEPIRTKESDETTEAELEASTTKPLGIEIFRLSNLDYIGPDFRPDPFIGHKLQVKGYLVRQPNFERINVTSLETVAPTCSL